MDLTKLKKGQEVMVSSGRGGYIPTIYWGAKDETHYLAFITPLAEVPKLLTHFIRTAGGWRFFICRKNEIFEDESQGMCPVCDEYKDVIGDKANPAYKHIALAVELDPIEERTNGRKDIVGFKVKMDEYKDKEGKDRSSPHVGVISQSAKNFWTPLASHISRLESRGRPGDLNEVVYEIARNAKGDQTSYSFYEYELRPDLSDFELPTLESWIEEKGAASYYAEELSDGVASEEEGAEGSEPETQTRAKGDQSDTNSAFEELTKRLEERTEEVESKS